jgi:hypothetical protein
VPPSASEPSCTDGEHDANGGLANEQDLCVIVANASQEDSGEDGVGDACDDDLDNDGVANARDHCMTSENPDQTDADGNGVGDTCEAAADDGEVDASGRVPLPAGTAVVNAGCGTAGGPMAALALPAVGLGARRRR